MEIITSDEIAKLKNEIDKMLLDEQTEFINTMQKATDEMITEIKQRITENIRHTINSLMINEQARLYKNIKNKMETLTTAAISQARKG